MLLEALDPAVKSDIIARKANQAAPKILFRLYTTYQPGGTGERNLVLTNLQNPSAVHDATSGVSALRAWGRWYQRCVDFGMNLPDPMVLVGALTAMTKPVISKDVEVTWRTEMVKSALQLHARPSEEAVRSYHKHLLAEFETLAGASKPKKGDVPKVQAFDASGGSGGNGNPSGGAGAKGGGKGKTCKYFLSPKGCKYGAECRSPHSMSELSKAERFKKCLNCGSEEHRAADCKATRRKDLTQQEPKSKPQVAQVSPPASSALPLVPATPLMSMDSFIQQATQALRGRLRHRMQPQVFRHQPLHRSQPQSLPHRKVVASISQHHHHHCHPSNVWLSLPSCLPVAILPPTWSPKLRLSQIWRCL